MPSATRSRRRRLSRSLAALTTTAVLGASLVALAAPAAAAPAATQSAAAGGGPPAAVPELNWVDCAGGVECATAEVPLDYDDPAGETITLSVARLPAANQEEKIGSLFFNPGGPGGSAVQLLLGFGNFLFPPQVSERFDIVAVDPRGVGFSTAVECFDSFGEELVFYADDVIFPVGPEEERAAADKSVDFADRCWENEGDLLPHLSTANVARDHDLIRQAVGDDQFHFVGFSYGTYLGATYANLFPENVGSMVLDGVMSVTYGGPLEAGATAGVRVGSHVGSAEALQRFFDLCAEAGEACPFGVDGDPRAKFDELLGRLRTDPIEMDFGDGTIFEIGYAEVIASTISNLYAADWSFLGSDLQFLYEEQTTDAAFRLVERAAHAHPASPVELLEQGGATRGFTVGDPGGTSVECADTDSVGDPFAFPEIAAKAEADAPYAGEFWVYATGSQSCASWRQVDDDRYLGPFDAQTAAPVLIIGNRFDPATPYANAVALERIMPGSRLVTLDSGGHTASGGLSDCVDAAVTAYLLEGTLPAAGTVCQPNFQPFELATPPEEPVPVEPEEEPPPAETDDTDEEPPPAEH